MNSQNVRLVVGGAFITTGALVVIGFMLAGYDSVLDHVKSVIMALTLLASGGVLLAWEPGSLQYFVNLFRLDQPEVNVNEEPIKKFLEGAGPSEQRDVMSERGWSRH